MNCRGTLASFRRFLPVVPLRKLLFSVFHQSYPYAERFFAFFCFRRPTKPRFSRFLLVVGVRQAIFAVLAEWGMISLFCFPQRRC